MVLQQLLTPQLRLWTIPSLLWVETLLLLRQMLRIGVLSLDTMPTVKHVLDSLVGIILPQDLHFIITQQIQVKHSQEQDLVSMQDLLNYLIQLMQPTHLLVLSSLVAVLVSVSIFMWAMTSQLAMMQQSVATLM